MTLLGIMSWPQNDPVFSLDEPFIGLRTHRVGAKCRTTTGFVSSFFQFAISPYGHRYAILKLDVLKGTPRNFSPPVSETAALPRDTAFSADERILRREMRGQRPCNHVWPSGPLGLSAGSPFGLAQADSSRSSCTRASPRYLVSQTPVTVRCRLKRWNSFARVYA